MLALVLAVRTLPFAMPAAVPAVAPALTAAPPLAAASLPLPPSLPPLPAPAAAPAPAAPAAPAFLLKERRGRDSFGREVVVLDLVDREKPGAGTVGHLDYSLRDAQASLDQPLDSWLDPARREENLAHFREHLWFGLAVRPEYRARGLGARLMDEAVARMRAEGVRTLFIRATESSRPFYLKRFGARVRRSEAETDRDGETTYRLEIDLS